MRETDPKTQDLGRETSEAQGGVESFQSQRSPGARSAPPAPRASAEYPLCAKLENNHLTQDLAREEQWVP